MIDTTRPLEWDDGTPVIGDVVWQGNVEGRKSVRLTKANGADDKKKRVAGFYDQHTGWYAGFGGRYKHIRNVVTGPEPYEEWFK